MLLLLLSFASAKQFTVAFVPDTQTDVVRGAAGFQNSMNWVCQCNGLGIKGVFGLGDVTHKHTAREWADAQRATACLRSQNIVNGWARGNHDLAGYNFDVSDDAYDQYTHFWHVEDMDVLVYDFEADANATAWARAKWHNSTAPFLVMVTHHSVVLEINGTKTNSADGTPVLPDNVREVIDGWEPNEQLGFVVGGHYALGISPIIAKVDGVLALTINFQEWGVGISGWGDWPVNTAGVPLQYWTIDTDEMSVCARTYSPGMGFHLLGYAYQWRYDGGVVENGCRPYVPDELGTCPAPPFRWTPLATGFTVLLVLVPLLLLCVAIAFLVGLQQSQERRRRNVIVAKTR